MRLGRARIVVRHQPLKNRARIEFDLYHYMLEAENLVLTAGGGRRGGHLTAVDKR
jgi:hypothetical protein